MIRFEQVSHTFKSGTRALSQVNFEVQARDFTVFIGPSGAGKSTLLRMINGLIEPTSGLVQVGTVNLRQATRREVLHTRRSIGMVFQQFNLVKRLSALDNVLLGRLGYLPAWRNVLKAVPRQDREFALHLLDRVGMADHAWQRADTLSGGQQQRVGIARALAQSPRIILADEPISALDPKSSDEVMNLLRDIHERDGIQVIANLHFLDTVREYADRVIGLRKGEVVFDGTPLDLTHEAAHLLYYGEHHTELPIPNPVFAATPA